MSLKRWLLEGIKNHILKWPITLFPQRDFFPSGHFHSPIPSFDDLKTKFNRCDYQDIELNEEQQFHLLKEFSNYYTMIPFGAKPKINQNYYFQNRYFSYSDGVILFCMLSHFKPRKIIEIGAGFSTACMLDTLDLTTVKTDIHCYTIQADKLDELTKFCPENVQLNIEVKDIREVPLESFKCLVGGDILFVDSSHVSKYNSDLNQILFKILPILNSNVFIHFHDIFKNFEYPEAWLDEGIYWNEQYLLRAFLQNNSDYEIIIYSDYLEDKYHNWYKENMPLCLETHEKYSIGSLKGEYIKDLRGQSLWLRKK